MPQDVIDRVNLLGRRSNAALDLAFAWRDGTPIVDPGDMADDSDDDDSAYQPSFHGSDDSDDDDDDNDDIFHDDQSDGPPVDAIAGKNDDDDNDNGHQTDGHQTDAPIEDNVSANQADAPIEDNASANDEHETESEAPIISENEDDNSLEHTGVPQEDDDDDEPVETTGVEPIEMEPTDITGLDEEDEDEEDLIRITGITGVDAPAPDISIEERMNLRYGAREHQHDLRPRKPRDYHHLYQDLEHTALTQYNVKKGLKVFGEAGAKAVIEEMQQLHDREVIQPKMANMLTTTEKKRSLQYLMFLKQKRCGRIKGRGCADGRKQRIYKTKEETSAPTVSVESLFLSCVIDAKEHTERS